MGANEKYEAAMHGRLSTPSMDIMRLFYKIGRRSRLPDVSIDSMNAEFDRFIDGVRADAKAEALNEALTVLQAEIEDAPPANHEEDNYEAGYIAGLDFLLNAKALANQYKESPNA